MSMGFQSANCLLANSTECSCASSTVLTNQDWEFHPVSLDHQSVATQASCHQSSGDGCVSRGGAMASLDVATSAWSFPLSFPLDLPLSGPNPLPLAPLSKCFPFDLPLDLPFLPPKYVSQSSCTSSVTS